MDNELKQDLTRRLSQCNRGGLILVMYDIYFAYSDDAKKALEMGDDQAFKKGIENAQAGLDELVGALDFKYPITDQLFSLYSYCKKQLSKAIYEKTVEKIVEADTIMKKLRGSFKIAAEQDTSGPIMENTQKVYAGITYGRTQLNENCIDDTHRGFFA